MFARPAVWRATSYLIPHSSFLPLARAIKAKMMHCYLDCYGEVTGAVLRSTRSGEVPGSGDSAVQTWPSVRSMMPTLFSKINWHSLFSKIS